MRINETPSLYQVIEHQIPMSESSYQCHIIIIYYQLIVLLWYIDFSLSQNSAMTTPD